MKLSLNWNEFFMSKVRSDWTEVRNQHNNPNCPSCNPNNKEPTYFLKHFGNNHDQLDEDKLLKWVHEIYRSVYCIRGITVLFI